MWVFLCVLTWWEGEGGILGLKESSEVSQRVPEGFRSSVRFRFDFN